MYTEKSNSHTYCHKENTTNRAVHSVPVQRMRQPVSQSLPNQVRLVSKSGSDVKQLQAGSRHMTAHFQQDYRICQKKSMSTGRMDTKPADTGNNVIQREIDWDRFQEAFNYAGTLLNQAAGNVFHHEAPQIFAYAKIRYTEKIAFRIIGKVSRAYNTVENILQSTMKDALAWVNPTIDTIININEDHVNQAPIEDVAITILHELSHYNTSLDTDDIEYLYTQEDFEQGSDELTYETAINNADSIAYLIYNLGTLA
ncbi:MAG: M35 family metallo-endopeptidase [Clostridium sp.]|nr:M35 family metallo-endopeptidase [Clostridium sp.]